MHDHEYMNGDILFKNYKLKGIIKYGLILFIGDATTNIAVNQAVFSVQLLATQHMYTTPSGVVGCRGRPQCASRTRSNMAGNTYSVK